jgi:O-antigen ligase
VRPFWRATRPTVTEEVSPAAAPDERAHGGIGRGWVVWAVAVMPVMLILPMYVFPLPTTPPIPTYDGRRLLEILWAAGLLLALGRPSIRAASAQVWARVSVPTRMAGIGFLAWALLSSVVSSAPAYALREWSLVTLLAVVIFPLATILASTRTRVLDLLGLTLVLYAILVFAAPLEHGFAHPRFLGHVIAVAGAALLFSSNVTLALLAAPALAIGILNGSRALVVTLVVVAIAALLLWPEPRRRMLPAAMGLAVAMILVGVFAILGHDASLHEAVERGTSSTGRTLLWRETFARFTMAPVLGEGPGLLARNPGIAGWAAHPHNTVLLIAAETGLIGLLLASVLAVQGLRRLRVLTLEYQPWGLAILAGCVDSMFNSSIIVPASQALLVLALALALPATGDASHGGRHNRAGWGFAVVGALALVVLLSTLFLPSADFDGTLQGPRLLWRGVIP